MNMEANIPKGRPDTAEEAELWFVRVTDPGCPPEQRAAFERWRAASADNEAAYRQAELLWSLGAEAIADDTFLQFAAHRATRAPRRRRPWALPALAAAALVAAAILVPRWLPQRERVGSEYTTAVGQRRTVTLPDGSSMVLDTNSDVRVSYDGTERHIDLLHGRAQFHVQGNKHWPFVVHAQDGTVTAVGTRFQVRLDPDKVHVALLEGKLAIATQHDGDSRHASLLAGQQLEFDRSGEIGPVRPVDLQVAEGWTDGKLFVDNWRLVDLVAEMNRYSRTQLELGDPSLADLRISGVFRTDDQKTLLLVLQQGWSIRAAQTAPGRLMLSRR